MFPQHWLLVRIQPGPDPEPGIFGESGSRSGFQKFDRWKKFKKNLSINAIHLFMILHEELASWKRRLQGLECKLLGTVLYFVALFLYLFIFLCSRPVFAVG
jgi:hypothetical protein